MIREWVKKMVCSNCNSELDDSALVCDNCGTEINSKPNSFKSEEIEKADAFSKTFSGNFVPIVQDNNSNIKKRMDDSINLNKFKIEFKKFETPANKINYLYDNFNQELYMDLIF